MEEVAEIHHASLVPGKLQLLRSWLPRQAWFDDDPQALRSVGSYRLLDPAGQVGIETHLLQGARTTWHIPLTYRAQPLPHAEQLGTMEHGVLGTRHVALGTSDATYLACTTATIRSAGHQAALSDGTGATAQARGSGLGRIAGERGEVHLELVVALRVDQPVTGVGTLQVSWQQDGRPHQAWLAALVEAP